MYMSAIFKTDSGIFGHLEASDVTVTGQIKIGNHSVATENFVNQTVISGADYSLEINYLSGQADTISGDLVSLSSTVDAATGNLYGFFDKDENLLSNVSGNFSKLTFGSHGVPETSSSSGVVGQIAYSQSHIYICTEQNTWRRCPIGDF